MDEEIKSYLVAISGQLSELKSDISVQLKELKSDVATLKTDVAALKTDVAALKTDVAALKTDVSALQRDVAALQAQDIETRREIREHTEAVETRLLTEFWKWAKTADARYRQAHGAIGAMDDRMQLLEDRVSELERRRAS